MRYPFVLLDVGETLIGPRVSYGAIYAEVLADLGLELSAEGLDDGIREASRELRREIPPGTDRFSHFPGGEAELWLRFARRSIGLAAGQAIDRGFAALALEALRERFKRADTWVVYEDVRPTLESLKGQGCSLAVVSNWDSRLPGLLKRLGLEHWFEVLGVSHLEGVEKPNPELFRRVLDRLDARAEQALHVGNLPEEDLEGARAAGIDGLLVDRKGTLDGDWPTIPDLRRLPEIVAQGGPPDGLRG
jgi:putative hydrolase of the HAD superfamily